MRRVVAACVERLDLRAEGLEGLSDGAIDVAFSSGLSELERLFAVPTAQRVDQFLRLLPAERNALAVLAPPVAGQGAVELETNCSSRMRFSRRCRSVRKSWRPTSGMPNLMSISSWIGPRR